LEEWAVAICENSNVIVQHGSGQFEGRRIHKGSCSSDEKEKITTAFVAFKKYIVIQAEDERRFAAKFANQPLSFNGTSVFESKVHGCQLVHKDRDEEFKFQPWWEVWGGSIGHDDKKSDFGTWSPRVWSLKCRPNRSELEKKCTERCSVDDSTATLLLSAGCKMKGLDELESRQYYGPPKEEQNRKKNWVYDIGVVCPAPVQKNCRNKECLDFKYKVYYSSLAETMEQMEEMANKLKERQIITPPYQKVNLRLAIPGSFQGLKTGFIKDESHWAKQKAKVCLMEGMKTDPFKHKPLGTTCCRQYPPAESASERWFQKTKIQGVRKHRGKCERCNSWLMSDSLDGNFSWYESWRRDNCTYHVNDLCEPNEYRDCREGCNDDDSKRLYRPLNCKTGSFEEAEWACTKSGFRLCTAEELMSGMGETSGCGFDDSLVWSSDYCEDSTTMFTETDWGHRIVGQKYNPFSNKTRAPPTSCEECKMREKLYEPSLCCFDLCKLGWTTCEEMEKTMDDYRTWASAVFD